MQKTVKLSPQIITAHNCVVHSPFEQYKARPPSTVPQFLFQSVKGLSKANFRFIWVLLFLLKMIYQ